MSTSTVGTSRQGPYLFHHAHTIAVTTTTSLGAPERFYEKLRTGQLVSRITIELTLRIPVLSLPMLLVHMDCAGWLWRQVADAHGMTCIEQTWHFDQSTWFTEPCCGEQLPLSRRLPSTQPRSPRRPAGEGYGELCAWCCRWRTLTPQCEPSCHHHCECEYCAPQ